MVGFQVVTTRGGGLPGVHRTLSAGIGRLGKALTFSHWDQRPLSNVQLRYAADDVRYLPALRQAIGDKLNGSGQTEVTGGATTTGCGATWRQ